MNRLLLPKINFKAYRHSRYLRACYYEWGRGAMVYGLRYVRESCPLCQPPGSRSRVFSWSFDKCAYYCHKCKARGDAIQLVRDVSKCSAVEAAKWLEQKAGPAESGLVIRD